MTQAGPWDADAMWTPEEDETPKKKPKEAHVEPLRTPLRQYELRIVVAERDDCEPIGPTDIELMVAGQLLSGAFLDVLEVTLTDNKRKNA